MKKTLLILITGIFGLFLTIGVTMAADLNQNYDLSAEGIEIASDGASGTVEANEITSRAFTNFTLQFGSAKKHYGAFAIKVDQIGGIGNVTVWVRDLQANGDSWVATFGKRTGAKVTSTSNRDLTSGNPYPAGSPSNNLYWSSSRTVKTKATTIWVVPGKVTAGFPAQMQVYVQCDYPFKWKVYAYK